MTWKKTSCVMCGLCCGLEVQVEKNRIVKVRPDKQSPISEGYICRKGMNIAYHEHNSDRLLYPMKKVDGKFERISWDQAIGEIAEKLKPILQTHGPRSLASVTGGGEYNFYTSRFPSGFVQALGSRYLYSSANQEFAGRYWAHGLTLGSQMLEIPPDYVHSDMFLTVGWNGMMSHGIPQTRKVLPRFAKDPDKLLVAIDPRCSETAKAANIHLALRPGTDALLLKSMIAIIIRDGMHNQDYIDKYVSGFEEIRAWFAGWDVNAALKVCELEYDQVFRVCREFATRRSCLRDDLGILMNRNSALVSYLLVMLLAICGRIGVPGGNYLAGGKMYSDPNDPRTWRTPLTNIPALGGMFPPNVLPEEIMSDRPDRLRAAFVMGANPLRSWADTTAFEEAFARLDLLVVTEIAMSETAHLAHYVLPCTSTYGSWSPEPADRIIPSPTDEYLLNIYSRMRQPVVEMEGEQKETGEIFTLLAHAMGLIPTLPDSLYQAAESGNLKTYRDALTGYLMEHPENMKKVPFIAAETLGKAIGSTHLASHFTGSLQRSPAKQAGAVAAGFEAGEDQGLAVYQALIDHPEGVLIGVQDLRKNLGKLATGDGRIRLYTAEAEEGIKKITPEEEEQRLKANAEFPLILLAGRHMDMNANTSMRDPVWNEGRRACTLAMNPADAKQFGFSNGQMVKVITEAGEETIAVEVTEDARKGQVIMPHGFGLVYEGVKFGANVNRLAKNTNRDQFGTPMHRYVPCRVEAM